MKKILAAFSLTFMIVAASFLSAFANINSQDDIQVKINQLYNITNYDFLSLVNKNELIGERLSSFNMVTTQYKNEVFLAQNNLKNIANQIELIKASSDIPESEKKFQMEKLYQDANTILYSIDSKAVQYLYTLKFSMPSLTYQRYSQSFQDYYNSLNISNKALMSK